MTIEKHERIALYSILALAFALRLVLALVPEVVLRSDSLEYHEYGANLAAEGKYYVRYHGPQQGWHDAILYSHRAPGYPFFLAALYAVFGPNARAALIAQALIDTFTTFLVFLLCRRYLKGWPLWAAVILYALHPLRVSLVMTEVLFTPIFIGLLLLLDTGRAQKSAGVTAAAGALFGYGALVRPALIIFAPLIGAWYLSQVGWKRAVVLLAVWTATTTAVVGPWLVREYLVHGRFVFVTTIGGRTYHDGNYIPVDATKIIVAGRTRGLDEVEIDDLFYNVTKKYLDEHPRHRVKNMFRRLSTLWEFGVTGEFKNLLFEPLAASPSGLRRAVGGLALFLFALSRATTILAGLGALVSLRRFRRLLPFYLIPLWVSLFHFLYYQGVNRYLAPIVPIFCLFVGLLAQTLRDRTRKAPT